jgi:hypothetical protein
MLRVPGRVRLRADEGNAEDEGGDGAECELRTPRAGAGNVDPALSHGGSVADTDEESM